LIALAIVSQAEPWLAGGRSSTGNVRRERAAAGYDLVQEAAERLARSAAHPAGADAITELTQELHEVESAVAQLLGAVAAESNGAGDPTAGLGDETHADGGAAGRNDRANDPASAADETDPTADAEREPSSDVATLVPRQRPPGEWTTTGVLPPAGGDRR
jgi:hypothetical protein